VLSTTIRLQGLVPKVYLLLTKCNRVVLAISLALFTCSNRLF